MPELRGEESGGREFGPRAAACLRALRRGLAFRTGRTGDGNGRKFRTDGRRVAASRPARSLGSLVRAMPNDRTCH